MRLTDCELCPYGYDYYQCEWEWPDVNFDENLYISDEEGVLEEFYEYNLFDYDNVTDPFPWARWNEDAAYEEIDKSLL